MFASNCQMLAAPCSQATVKRHRGKNIYGEKARVRASEEIWQNADNW